MTTPADGSTSPAPAPDASPPPADTSVTAARDLATVLDTPPPTTASFIKGVVTAINLAAAPPVVSIQVSGDTSTTINNVRMLDSYTPVVGDTCIVGKQDTNVFIIGQINDTGTGSANGWVTPTLSTNVTTNGNTNGPVQYRVVVDGGDLKVQCRGSVAVAAGATALFSVTGNAIPSAQRNMLTARDINGSTIAVQVQFATSGAVTLSGSALGETTDASAPGTTDTGGAAATNTGTGGDAAGTSGSSSGTTGSYTVSGPTDTVSHSHGGAVSITSITHNFTDAAHTHTSGAHTHTVPAGSHSHTIPSGTHTHTVAATHTHTITIPAATWVSFNGIEYFV